MKPTARTTAGIRAGNFTDMVLFLTEVLGLEIVLNDQEKEFARFGLPSGQILEVFGPKQLWQPFTARPDWEVIVADIRYRPE